MGKLQPDVVTESPAGRPAVLDQVILGVTHQISNRVATLAGVSDILSGDPNVPPILRALADEVPKLEESIRLLRLLAVPDNEAEEAMEIGRAVSDAIALVRLHPSLHDVNYSVASSRDVPPVVAQPITLTHSILAGLATAAADRARVEVGYAVADGMVLVRISGAPDVSARALG